MGMALWSGRVLLGKFLKLDGTKYEGEWKNNKAFGFGRFFHIDGDYCNVFLTT